MTKKEINWTEHKIKKKRENHDSITLYDFIKLRENLKNPTVIFRGMVESVKNYYKSNTIPLEDSSLGDIVEETKIKLTGSIKIMDKYVKLLINSKYSE